MGTAFDVAPSNIKHIAIVGTGVIGSGWAAWFAARGYKVTAFVPGALLALFGLFIAFQTATLRFTFDDKEFSLVKADLSSTGENVVVGGENRWAYDKFVNYDFFNFIWKYIKPRDQNHIFFTIDQIEKTFFAFITYITGCKPTLCI